MNYSDLIEVYEQIEGTSKRLEKTFYLSELIRKTKTEDLKQILLLSRGLLFPEYDERKIGVAARLVIKAINTSTGIHTNDIEKEWKKTGDLGLTAENLVKRKQQHTLFKRDLTVDKVFSNLRKLAELEGEGTVERKTRLISELLTNATPKEAKYIIRTLLEDLRVGLGEGAVRDALVWAFYSKEAGIKYDEKSKSIEVEDRAKYNEFVARIEEAYNLTNDYAEVAERMKKGMHELKNLSLAPNKAVRVMLAQKVKDFDEGFEVVGKPCAIEFKYDGFRMLIGRNKNNITIHTRRLENVTKQFSEVVEYVKEHIKGDSYIIDGEAVGYNPKTKKYLAFQSISQRIKRKYDIEKMAKDFPVELNIFDILYYDGKNLLKNPYIERRKLLEKIIKNPTNLKIRLAEQIVTDKKETAEKFYKKSLDAGNEGVMLKNLQGIYKPGSRVGYMVKLKPVMETLDLVIIGAEWGEGKRSGWLSSYAIACLNKETNEYEEVGKVATGVKELEEQGLSYEELTQLLKPLVTEEKGKTVKVKPKIVIEVHYEEIQKSPTYNSGYALRFPRVIRIREDRSPKEINTIDDVERLYKGQRQR